MSANQNHRKLILVKHAQPEIIPNVPACEWHLSAQGQAQSRQLAQKLALYQPVSIFSSVEPKARETAQIVAQHLAKFVLTFETVEGLHEHERRHVGFLSERRFHQEIKKFFAHPGQLVFGEETAQRANERFTRAIEAILEQSDDQNVVIVTHGTVITLFVAQFNKTDAFVFWKNLKLPSFVVLAIPAFEFIEIVDEV